jgi:hypothetical protein
MSTDPVILAPELFKVVLENDRVRILDIRGKPGDGSPMHTHPATVTIAMSDFKATSYAPDGAALDIEMKAGQVACLDPIEHSDRIGGTADIHLICIELK